MLILELIYTSTGSTCCSISLGKAALLTNTLIGFIGDHAQTALTAGLHDCRDFHGDATQAVICCKRSAMTGRRLLDLAAIFKASRGIAAKHVSLRRHQLDIYSKTSTLAKAIKSQTDRVTLTVRAASVLAERFNGPGPDYSTQLSQSRRSREDAPIPSSDGVPGTTEELEKKHDLFQDHFYKRSDQNTPAGPPPGGNLGVKQENANIYPLPDGSKFPADTAEVPKRVQESYSTLPQTGPVKAPIADGREGTDEGLQPTSSGRTSIPSPAEGNNPVIAEKAKSLQRQAEKQIPSQAVDFTPTALSEEPSFESDQDREVFYTPSSSNGQVLSALPCTKLPKNMEDAQESDEHVPHAQINQDVFYSSSSESELQPVPQAQAVPEQEQLPGEVYTELFHNPKIARMLGGQPKPSKPSKGLEMSGAQETPVKQTKPPQEKDQVSSSIRTSAKESQYGGQKPPSGIVGSKPSQAKGSEDVHDLAADMAKDAEAMSTDSSRVRSKQQHP